MMNAIEQQQELQALLHDRKEQHLKWMNQDLLGKMVSERRKDRMLTILMQRLTRLTVVTENFYDAHNVSAVIRSAEGFGLDTVHVIQQPKKFERAGGILRGSDRWINIQKHNKLTPCLEQLKAEDYLLAVADVGRGCVPITELPTDQKIAIVMGSEHAGLSKRAKNNADLRFTIPMAGFTESFNVSVSAAIAIYELGQKYRQKWDGPQLSFEEEKVRLDEWLRNTVKHSERILRLAGKKAAIITGSL